MEHGRLKSIWKKLDKCRLKLDKLNIASGGVGELSDSQFIDWLHINTNDNLEQTDPIESLQPDTSRPFIVSMVELGVHPHSIDIKNVRSSFETPQNAVKVTKSSHENASRSENNQRVDKFGFRPRASHASREDETLFGNFEVEEKKVDESEDRKEITPALSAARSEEPERYQEAYDALYELSEKVAASLDEEVAKISNHSREVIDEITRQGDIMRQQLTEDENKRITGIDAESDRCRQRVDKLQAFCDTLSKLTDNEYIAEYSRIINDIKEIISNHISYSEKDTDAPKLVCGGDLTTPSLCVGNVFITKRVYLRKQLITQFSCDATIIGIDASADGNIVIAGYASATIGNLQVWSNISGAYQRILATEVSGNNSITGVTLDQINNRYVVARTTTVESYSPLGICETELLADCGSEDNATLNIQSIAINAEGLIVIGDIQTCTITVLSVNGIAEVIPVPFHPYKMTTYGTNVVYTDVTSDRVHCINYISHRDIFNIHVPKPTGVCFDKSTACLYICKSGSTYGCNAIGFYCGISGEVKEEEVISGLGAPQDVCLLQGGKELAVADGSCVKIYCLK
ncbi:uncharacterized protein [Amphiura filiformis]|uniref:uncharacterized protein n=1 Tax=Amphiura filiformis TaxID=82378 RepID=UPI003B224B1D